MADLDTLRASIADGSVDTVIVAFPDLQGRPVGKRVTASFFVDHVAEHGIEACDYLLAVDVDMEPLPGYRFASWDAGYGDMVAVPDYSTVRLLPWLPGSALVLCDLFETGGRPVEVSPRRVLARQLERAAERGLAVQCATELEFYLFEESFAEAAGARWHGLTPHSSSRRRARSTSSGASATRWWRPASRSSSPRARPAGVSTRSTSPTPGRSRRPTGTWCSRTG
jgi:glutamine synthetase